jgi:hypothetical protein
MVGSVRARIRDWRSGADEAHLETTRLIRRWREADHPGENMLVALLARAHLLESGGKILPSIGIGWGGIELPVAYRQVCVVSGDPAPSALAVHYSTYSKFGSTEPIAKGISPGASIADAEGGDVLLFDDNSLSGRTLQAVREFLLLEHDVRADAIFVTRLSGERRYDQMRMTAHGVLDPKSVGEHVHGHLGETPFSRAWSRKDYANPLGIFSLAKRRILELLFANSSAERFDREGF